MNLLVDVNGHSKFSLDKRSDLTAEQTEQLNLFDSIGEVLGPVFESNTLLPMNLANTPDRNIECLTVYLTENGDDSLARVNFYRVFDDEAQMQEARESLFSAGTGVIRLNRDGMPDHGDDIRYRYGYGTSVAGEIPWLSEAPLADLRAILETDAAHTIDWERTGRGGAENDLEIARKWGSSYKAWIGSLIDERIGKPRQ